MSARSTCRTLSTKGNPVDYRPATHHVLYGLDNTFDFKYSALHWCNNIVDQYFKNILWNHHKSFVSKILEGIKENAQTDAVDGKIHVTYVATGLSDADRNCFISEIVSKIESEGAATVVDPHFERGCSAHDCLIQIADCLNAKRIDRHWLYKNQTHPPSGAVSQDLIKRAPLKAIATFMSGTPSTVVTYKSVPEDDNQTHGKLNKTLLVVLRHCEMIDIDVLNNLLLLLTDPILNVRIRVLAFTDTMCSLPVQLSPAVQAIVRATTCSTATAWEIYDALFGRLFSGRDIPVQFTPGLIEIIHTAFRDSEMCVSTAVHRFKLCLAEHFEHSLALLCMYRETTWLQKTNVMSKSEIMLGVAPPPKKARSSSSLARSKGARGSTESLYDEMSVTNMSEDAADEHTAGDTHTDSGSVMDGTITSGVSDSAPFARSASLGSVTVQSSALSAAVKGTRSLPMEIVRLRHRHGITALLTVVSAADLEDNGLSAADGSVVVVLESCEARTAVDFVWFTCLKMMRDSILPKDKRNRFTADVIWADILSRSSADSSASRRSSGISSLDSARRSTELVHAIKDHLPQSPFTFVQDLLSELRAYLDNHGGDVSEEYAELSEFLSALGTGVRKLEATFEVVADCFEGTALSLSSSLLKMKQQMRANPSGVQAQSMEVNLVQRQSVTLNSVSVYEESLVDLSNWIVSAALHYVSLPPPHICRLPQPAAASTVSTGVIASASGSARIACANAAKAMTAFPDDVMEGILVIGDKAERNAVEALNGNLHATFVSALKDPKSLLLRAQEAADEAAELALRRGERSDGRGQGKRVSVKTGTTSTASAAAVRFNPDAALLYNLIKSCQQRDVANAWYDSFVSAVKGRPWDEVTTDKRKKRRNLDETTILKCRFASALYELEKSGIIKCQSVGPHNPTVTIEKKIYTWI